MAVVIFALGIKSANGLVKSTINTANSFADRGVDVSIVNIVGNNGGLEHLDAGFPLNKNVKKYSLDAMYSQNYDNIYDLESNMFHEEKQQFLTASYHQRHAQELKNINKKLSANDLVIFSHPLAMVLFVKANPKSEVKKIIQVHGNYIEEVDNFNLLKDYVKNVDYIQCVSKYMRDDLVELIDCDPNKVISIYNIARPLNLNKKKDKNLKRISIIGSIQKRKNQLDAIKILTFIKDRNVVLQIFGKALKKDYMDRLKEYISLNNLTDRVIFKDVANEKEIYENTDIAIMTSEHEGFGYIFLECAMYRIPVLAYDFKYGAKEFTRDGQNGCLFEMFDYKSMANKIEDILDNHELYGKIVKENFQYFEQEYSEENIMKKYLSLYEEKSNILVFNSLSKNKKDEKSNLIKDISYKIETVEEENLLTDNIEKRDYYIFDIALNYLPNNMKFYYQYKKTKFNAEYESAVAPKLLFHNKASKVKLKVALINRLSLNKPMKKFKLSVFTDNQEIIIGEMFNGSFINYGSSEEREFIISGEKKIKDVEHVLNPFGMWIRYPSYEPILYITDEDGNDIKYESKNLRYYGKTLPFFNIPNNIYKRLYIYMVSENKLIIDFTEYSYKNIFVKMQELEIKYNLFDLKIQDIYFWELIRANLFENILEGTGVLARHFNKKSTPVQNTYNGTKSLSKLKIDKEEKLIFEFPRKKDDDYKTYAAREKFKDAIVIEYPQENGYSDKVYEEDSNSYPIYDFLNNKSTVTIKYTHADTQIIRSLKKIFIDQMGLDIEFSLFIKSRLIKFIQEFNYFKAFFKKNRFSEVLIPSSYWSAGIVYAAKYKGIIVSDIQYALISKYHPSFSFPVKGRAYGADRIYLWSKYWNIKEVPFNKSIVLDSNYFKEKVKILSIDEHVPIIYDTAFISQNRISKKIIKAAYDYALKEKRKKFVFCPHPDDIGGDEYQKLESLNNVYINEGSDTLMAVSQAKNVVGVYSTTLFEALALNKNVYVLKINGYEVVEKEIDKGYFILLDDIISLDNKKNSFNNKIDFTKLFFN